MASQVSSDACDAEIYNKVLKWWIRYSLGIAEADGYTDLLSRGYGNLANIDVAFLSDVLREIERKDFDRFERSIMELVSSPISVFSGHFIYNKVTINSY